MNWVLRILVFAACIPSGGALLAKVYGIAEMQTVTFWIAIPCFIAILGVYLYSRKHLSDVSDDIRLGAIGGLIGTFGYDLIRIPFLLNGQRVFAPISVYGVWIAEAGASSRFTEVIGWAYHFSNGIAFGIMFVVIMGSRHWIWAVAWAMLLETIAVISPFADIFALRSAYGALFIAYLGHVAYGLPLGLISQYREWSIEKMNAVPVKAGGFVLLFLLFALLSPLINPNHVQSDSMTPEAGFAATSERLYPGFIRVNRSQEVPIVNVAKKEIEVINRKTGRAYKLEPNQSISLSLSGTGINQFYVKRVGRSHSSFLIVEPVEDFVRTKQD